MVFTLLKPACHPTSLKLVEERLQYLGQISNRFGDIAAKTTEIAGFTHLSLI